MNYLIYLQYFLCTAFPTIELLVDGPLLIFNALAVTVPLPVDGVSVDPPPPCPDVLI
ncbi:hypothetical protein Q5M85_22680 [Paraclostridium bifermentans]|nr:hypothetical protein [Paraclostridium bifermentans]